MSTFVDRGVSRGQRGGSPTVVYLSFLDRIFPYSSPICHENRFRVNRGLLWAKADGEVNTHTLVLIYDFRTIFFLLGAACQ
jgi:hypothetical protein